MSTNRTIKRYELKDKDVTAVVPSGLFTRYQRALKDTGLTNAQGFRIALTLYFADPSAWEETDEGEGQDRPTQANFHARLYGITGTWLEAIQDNLAIKRLARNQTGKVTQTDVITSVIAHFVKMSESGRLMSV